MGCRFPGGARRSRVASGRSCATASTRSRRSRPIAGTSTPTTIPIRTRPARCTRGRAAFLDRRRRVRRRSSSASRRAKPTSMDPQQRLLLEVTWEALEDAGRRAGPARGQPHRRLRRHLPRTTTAQLQIMQSDPSRFDLYYGSGIAHSIAAGRLSYVLGLQGPSLAVDTACSSSLVAVHLACQSLRRGECDMALAGGVNLILSPEHHVDVLQGAHAGAPTAAARPSTRRADGFVARRGLRRRRAQAASRRAWPTATACSRVIRGSAVNQDGAEQRADGAQRPGAGGRDPRGAGERPASSRRDVELRRSARHRHVARRSHRGPGARRGAWRGARRAADPLLIGSVKTNIGHLEAAAGVAGLHQGRPGPPARRDSAAPALRERRTRTSRGRSFPIVVPTTAHSRGDAGDRPPRRRASARSASAAPTRTSSSRRRRSDAAAPARPNGPPTPHRLGEDGGRAQTAGPRSAAATLRRCHRRRSPTCASPPTRGVRTSSIGSRSSPARRPAGGEPGQRRGRRAAGRGERRRDLDLRSLLGWLSYSRDRAPSTPGWRRVSTARSARFRAAVDRCDAILRLARPRLLEVLMTTSEPPSTRRHGRSRRCSRWNTDSP